MHYGIITPPVAGHIHPFGALGRELIARGHRVTLLHMEDVRARAIEEGLEFAALGKAIIRRVRSRGHWRNSGSARDWAHSGSPSRPSAALPK